VSKIEYRKLYKIKRFGVEGLPVDNRNSRLTNMTVTSFVLQEMFRCSAPASKSQVKSATIERWQTKLQVKAGHFSPAVIENTSFI